jgi:hypothetical protein
MIWMPPIQWKNRSEDYVWLREERVPREVFAGFSSKTKAAAISQGAPRNTAAQSTESEASNETTSSVTEVGERAITKDWVGDP